MNSVPQVETREISDAAMDSISGGLTVAAAGSFAGGLAVDTPEVNIGVPTINGSASGSIASSL